MYWDFVVIGANIVQDSRPTGTIPLAGNRVIRHLDDQRNNTSFRFEIICMYTHLCTKSEVSALVFVQLGEANRYPTHTTPT